MPSAKVSAANSILRNLPSVDALLRSATARSIVLDAGDAHAAALIRRVIDEMRHVIGDISATTKENLLASAEERLDNVWRLEQLSGTRQVINATGVIIHTNLGRAPLSDAAKKAVAGAAGYCTLEYDIAAGKRGKRGRYAEDLLAELTGAEDVLIVNNCAAAAFFVLTAFAAGGEVIVSRGELVEIGGDFRVPDILEQSGATLREVGMTNRTKLADYAKAVNSSTRMILRVHPSNYRIVGFTAMPHLAELAVLAHENGILLYEDLGSGALIDLTCVGLSDEPVVRNSITAGADIVTFSGDKLLGGPQAGIIAGRRQHIVRLRQHPLYRALRVDKLAYAALEATLSSYRRDAALAEIPVLRMLSANKEEIAERLTRLTAQLSEISDLKFEIIDGVSAIGGGSAPAVQLQTKLLAVSYKGVSADGLETRLRDSNPPVIARIVDDRVVIDLRTVAESDEDELIASLTGAASVFLARAR